MERKIDSIQKKNNKREKIVSYATEKKTCPMIYPSYINIAFDGGAI